jgi:hypothetical protein
MTVGEAFFVWPKDIGTLCNVSIKVVVVGAIRVQVQLKEVGIIVRVHSDDRSRVEETLLYKLIFLFYIVIKYFDGGFVQPGDAWTRAQQQPWGL